MDQSDIDAGRWAQFNAFIDRVSPTLTPLSRDIWLVLFRHSDVAGISTVTRSRIAAMLGITKRHVSSGIADLRDRNLIAKTPNYYGYKISLLVNYPSPLVQDTSPLVQDTSPPQCRILHPPVNYTSPPNELYFTPPVQDTSPFTEQYIQNRYTEQITEERSSSPKKQVDNSEANFEAFWKAYPRRIGKGAARKAWSSVNGKATADVLMEAVEKQKQTKQWQDKGGQFIPHPATWLNQERWLDEVTAGIPGYDDDPDPLPF